MSSQKKMGFWAVTSLVVGSQIGSGIFLLPANLSKFGAIGLASWMITATGALLLALVFAKLCAEIPKTGGPHAFIESAFGPTIGFFAAWTYWVISWLSTPMVVISVVGYLSPLWGDLSPSTNLILEITIILFVMILNLSGVRSAGCAELVFTLLKLLPLILVPTAGLFFIKETYFTPFNPTSLTTIQALNGAALLTLWGFIGVESATTPADSVINPAKTIPRAIVLGTAVVALVYILGSFVIMGIVPPDLLAHSKAPFSDAAQIIFGGNWHLAISVAASIVCLGTLNAWVLTSGQIALGAASDGHLPQCFALKNAQGAPKWGLIISCLGMVPILILTLEQDLITQVDTIINISVTAFLFIYVLSALSYLKLFWKKKTSQKIDFSSLVIGALALLFCLWALLSSDFRMVGLATLITLFGIPVYYWKKRILSYAK